MRLLVANLEKYVAITTNGFINVNILPCRIECQLNMIETSHQIAERWTQDSQN